jgi:hypothetical protein
MIQMCPPTSQVLDMEEKIFSVATETQIIFSITDNVLLTQNF